MIIILDFGSQYTQLIARRIREFNVYCEIYPFHDLSFTKRIHDVDGIIFSGGPDSVYEKGAPNVSRETISYFMSQQIPILGICYGMQLLAHRLGGKVVKGHLHEYGFSEIKAKSKSLLFKNIAENFVVWMSHGGTISRLPKNFSINSITKNNLIAGFENNENKVYAIQFHPEVKHTRHGKEILKNFVLSVCHAKANWQMDHFIESSVNDIRQQVSHQPVICALSGGVDSSVAATLIHQAIKHQLHCVFVDNGLLRWGEKERVNKIFYPLFKNNLHIIDAKNIFLKKLRGVVDPEKKRKIIGNTFIRIFEHAGTQIEKKLKSKISFLVQGTLYPDVIESKSVKGPSQTIKTHHNVGGLPKRMNLKLIEPLKFLFKDEVRALGRELQIPEDILLRHPFPGPGLAVRIIGEITTKRLDLLKRADRIIEEEIRSSGLYNNIWQAFGVLLPVKSVGIMGDKRTYEHVLALRAVESQDAMTADWFHVPYEVLNKISNRVINEVRGINRVVYDISSKPPATIEWE